MRQASKGVKTAVDANRRPGGDTRNPPEVQAKRVVAKKAPERKGSKESDSDQRLADSLEREKAIGEILRVMSVSPGDVQPVLEAVAERASHLCDAPYANVLIRDGEILRPSAFSRLPEATSPLPVPLTRGSASGRAVLDRKIIHHADIVPFLDTEYPDGRQNVQRLGIRAHLAVPLLREGKACGAIVVFRSEPRPFLPEQIALVETFARQAVIAIENVRLFNETKEALERQSATSEVLEAISGAQTDASPVFETIARNAHRLSGAVLCNVLRYDGHLVHVAASYGFSPEEDREQRKKFPVKPGDASVVAGRVILSGRVEQIDDALRDPLYDQQHAATFGVRRMLGVPMLREGGVLGVIVLAWRESGQTSAALIDLLQTFAAQAVIAIENVRLFNETAEALERQTAISKILRAISSAPSDVRPMLNAVAERALALCEASQATIFLVDGSELRFAAGVGSMSTPLENERFPLTRGLVVGRAAIEGKAFHYPDILEVLDEYPDVRVTQAKYGFRALLAIPLMREHKPIGSIGLWRTQAVAFTEKQIALVETFADQAAIAIENVRLFNETREALERQTATADILRVISQSPTDVQPVFDTIADAAMKLCGGTFATVVRYDGEFVYIEALASSWKPKEAEAIRRLYPMPPSRGTVASRAVLIRDVVNIPDVQEDAEYEIRDVARSAGYRSAVGVPLMLRGAPIGAIGVGRLQTGVFPENQIALLKTFADQAVIAIENVRLFTELEARTLQLTRSVDELKALGDVGQAVSSTLDLETVLSTIVSRAVQLAGMDGGSIWEYEEAREEFYVRATHRLPDDLVEMHRTTPIRKNEGALGRLALIREPVEIRDIADEPGYPTRFREILIRSGYRSVLAVPLLREDHLLGALAVNRTTPGLFAPEVIALLKTFATQSALAIQNARLYREIEVKSRELEAASRHKSEFLANMSHELRTPLNAIIGFSEVLHERMFGEINEKQAEYIADILQSGQHLLSLINDILDLSKIEAGRMELEFSDFNVPSTIEQTIMLVRERAVRRGITLGRTIDEHLGMVRADERKVKQVLLNLLSNALKFTPEGGKIEVRAMVNDGVAEISVTDTGVGIAPEEHDAVFEEFRQVGTASKKVEGTGLGLAISRKFIELHGGTIWVASQVGVGSTFTFTLPLQRASLT